MEISNECFDRASRVENRMRVADLVGQGKATLRRAHLLNGWMNRWARFALPTLHTAAQSVALHEWALAASHTWAHSAASLVPLLFRGLPLAFASTGAKNFPV